VPTEAPAGQSGTATSVTAPWGMMADTAKKVRLLIHHVTHTYTHTRTQADRQTDRAIREYQSESQTERQTERQTEPSWYISQREPDSVS